MRILGIDPGLRVTGLGIIDGDAHAPRHVWHGVVRIPARLPTQERLARIREAIRAAAQEWRVEEAAMEASFVGRNARSALALGQARGAALLGLADAGIPLREYSPAEVKQLVAGYGAGGKEQIARMVALQLQLGAVPGPADAADALAVAIAHWARRRVERLPE